MNTQSMRKEDIVQCNVRGDSFYGLVKAMGPKDDDRLKSGEINVAPISLGRSSYRIVTARQITNHWRKRRTRSKT